MRRGREEASRWLKQAEHDLKVAEHNLKAGFYSDACFMAEQASQKALKAYLILRTGRSIHEHSIQALAKKAAAYDGRFREIVEYGMILDRYYILARYPDALAPPAVPYETYTKRDGEDAAKYAAKIVEIVKSAGRWGAP
jgi:HEPN domain-containing protein